MHFPCILYCHVTKTSLLLPIVVTEFNCLHLSFYIFLQKTSSEEEKRKPNKLVVAIPLLTPRGEQSFKAEANLLNIAVST